MKYALNPEIMIEVEEPTTCLYLPSGEGVRLNSAASYILNAIARGNNVDETAKRICANFSIDGESALSDVSIAVSELVSKSILLEISSE